MKFLADALRLAALLATIVALPGACHGTGLAGQAGQDRRGVRPGGNGGRARPADGGGTLQCVRPAVLCREQARQQRCNRIGAGGARRTRWLHAADRRSRTAPHRAGDQSEYRLRDDARFQPYRDDRRRQFHAGGESRVGRQDIWRSRHDCARQARGVRLSWRRVAGPSAPDPHQQGRRYQTATRALSQRRRQHDRPSWRSHCAGAAAGHLGRRACACRQGLGPRGGVARTQSKLRRCPDLR